VEPIEYGLFGEYLDYRRIMMNMVVNMFENKYICQNITKSLLKVVSTYGFKVIINKIRKRLVNM
jgi:hypothetical protein